MNSFPWFLFWGAMIIGLPSIFAQSSFQSLYQTETSVEVFAATATNGDLLFAADSYNDTANFFHRIWVQRRDHAGNSLQVAGIFRPPSFRLNGGIHPLSNNGLLLLGTTNIPLEDADSVFVSKLAADGQIEWAKGFQIEATIHVPAGALETSDGSLLVYGTYEHLGFAEGIFLFKISASGSLIWSRLINSQLNGAFMKVGGVVETSSGDLWLSGSTRFNSEGSWLAKLNAMGETQSVRLFDTHALTPSQPEPFAIHERLNGELDIFYRSTGFDSGPLLLAVHADANGMLLNGSTFSSGTDFGEITTITPDGNGGYLGGGYRFPTGGNRSSGVVLHFDDAYQVDWARTHGTSYIELITSILPKPDGGYIGAGFADFDSMIVSPSENGLFPWLFQTDADGAIACHQGNLSISTSAVTISSMDYQLDNIAGPGLGELPFSNISVGPPETEISCAPTANERLLAPVFQIYPNPSTGSISIQVDRPETYSFELVDLLGRKLEAELSPTATGWELTTRVRGLAILLVTQEGKSWSQNIWFREH
ncbi:MAG: T9SS type A sorting domain-containing protein [Bacteroidota bacterium]